MTNSYYFYHSKQKTMKKNLTALFVIVAAMMTIAISCMRPQPDELIIGTWKVDTIIMDGVDTSKVDLMKLGQALQMQKQVYFVVNENGQMDLISPFGAKTADWAMDNDSLILTATFIDNQQVSKIQFDEITETDLILVEESVNGTFTTKYKKQ